MEVTPQDVDAWMQDLGISMSVAHSETPTASLGRALIDLGRGASSQRFVLLYGSDVTLSSAMAALDDRPTLIATTAITPRRADAFRRAGLQYLDSAGNGYLEFGDVLVDVQGKRLRVASSANDRTPVNMFAPSRAQVVCALLTWPQLWNAPRRDVARAAGVSVGQAHQTLRALAELGYDQRPERSKLLLELWAAAFPMGLARRLLVDEFHGPVVGDIRTDSPVYVSGERAVPDLLRPGYQVLYVPSLDVRLPLQNRWRRDAPVNTVVRTAFWEDLFDTVAANLVRLAPWPLVYADLASSVDPRARDAAIAWRDQHG